MEPKFSLQRGQRMVVSPLDCRWCSAQIFIHLMCTLFPQPNLQKVRGRGLPRSSSWQIGHTSSAPISFWVAFESHDPASGLDWSVSECCFFGCPWSTSLISLSTSPCWKERGFSRGTRKRFSSTLWVRRVGKERGWVSLMILES